MTFHYDLDPTNLATGRIISGVYVAHSCMGLCEECTFGGERVLE
jgi:hypothetical protein